MGVGQKPEALTHPILHHHTAGNIAGTLQVVLSPRLKYLQRSPPPLPALQKYLQAIQKFIACHEVTIFGGKLLGIAQRGDASWNDGNPADQVGTGPSIATSAWPDSW